MAQIPANPAVANYSYLTASSPPPLPLPSGATNPIWTNPMFGRPVWTYTNLVRGPVRGPQPRLAQGTGRTSSPALPGNASQLPGYLSDNAYFPTLNTYQPRLNPSYYMKLARSIQVGEDGREMVGTYQPHDFTPADRFHGEMRSAPNWQVMTFPPSIRNLLAYQQAVKYQLQSYTLSARPLASQNYFLGYQIDPQVQSDIGNSSLGYMGSV